jgi:5S rRNA maturation endonuclease (ribonuclease M5)
LARPILSIQSSIRGIGNESDFVTLLTDLDSKLEHLDSLERKQLKQLIYEYKHLFPDIPTRTHKIYHDVDVGDATPIKQHPYRTNPVKHEYLRKEIKYLLDNDKWDRCH